MSIQYLIQYQLSQHRPCTDDMITPPVDPSPTLSVALVGAIAGGVVAVMVIVILVLTVVVILLACSRKRNNKDVSAIKGEAICTVHKLIKI